MKSQLIALSVLICFNGELYLTDKIIEYSPKSKVLEIAEATSLNEPCEYNPISQPKNRSNYVQSLKNRAK